METELTLEEVMAQARNKVEGPHRFNALVLAQAEQKAWADYNFGEKHGTEYAILGVPEEVGELCRAKLKHMQGIRGFETREEFEAAAKDAIGDISVYLMDICNDEGWNFFEIIMSTWEYVKQRDWKRFPKNGKTE